MLNPHLCRKQNTVNSQGKEGQCGKTVQWDEDNVDSKHHQENLPLLAELALCCDECRTIFCQGEAYSGHEIVCHPKSKDSLSGQVQNRLFSKQTTRKHR